MFHPTRIRTVRRHTAGVTLIELMIALAIGSFLMVGAVYVFMQARQSFRITEAVSRLQENARFALSALEPEIRMAHYWGLTTQTSAIDGRAGTPEAAALDPAPPSNCGASWTINLDKAIDANNNAYAWACAEGPAGGTAVAGADTVVIRRVSEVAEAAPLKVNTLYLQTRRSMNSKIFVCKVAPCNPPAEFLPVTAPPSSETRAVMATGFYVSQTSMLGAGVPSLRRKIFAGAATTPVSDEEILPYVEDLQIQLGVDTDPVGSANRGAVDRYVNPGDAILTQPNVEILAVRIWVRLRAENIEVGYTDTTAYKYADRDIPAPNDSYRRVVVSKTVYVRNARPPV